ncbi:hypothetical protein ACFSTD_08310 [Novosphingobium colocasiae]
MVIATWMRWRRGGSGRAMRWRRISLGGDLEAFISRDAMANVMSGGPHSLDWYEKAGRFPGFPAGAVGPERIDGSYHPRNHDQHPQPDRPAARP